MKSKVLIILLLTLVMLFGQHSKYLDGITDGSHLLGWEILVKANNRTTISLKTKHLLDGNDSTNCVLFDSLLSTDKIILLTDQSEHCKFSKTQEETILLLYPTLNPGMYTLEYVSQDTSFSFDFVYLR